MAEARQTAGTAKRPRLQSGSQPRPDSSEEDAEAPDQPGGVAMSVACWGGRVGVAWYSQEDGELFCMGSADDTTGPFRHQVLQLAKLHARPSVIYASSKADAELLAILRAPLAGAAAASTHTAAQTATGGTADAPAGHGGLRAAAQQASAAPAPTSAASVPTSAAPAPTSALTGEFDVRMERAALFQPRQARAVLEGVHIWGMPPGLSTRQRLHRLNALVSLSNEQQVCAAGALLAVLGREGRLGGCGSDGGVMVVNSISEVSLDGYLTVDPASLAALQIFQEEAHPAAAMGIGQPKEGFSVFGTINKCITPQAIARHCCAMLRSGSSSLCQPPRLPRDGLQCTLHATPPFAALRMPRPRPHASLPPPQGKRLLRLWFARPIVNLAVLEDRLDGVQFFLERPDAVQNLQAHLRKVKDAPRLLARLQSTQGLPDRRDFLQLQASLAAALLVRDALVQLAPAEVEASLLAASRGGGSHTLHAVTPTAGGLHTAGIAAAAAADGTPTSAAQRAQQGRWGATGSSFQAPSILFKAAATIEKELVLCHNMISGVIDSSASDDGLMILPGVSEELDALKELFYGLPDFLTQLVEAELRRVPRQLAAGLDASLWSIVYMPQVGFVVRLEGGRLPAHLEEQLPDYQFAFEGSGGGEEGLGVYYHCARTRELNERFGDVQHRIQDMEAAIAARLTQRLAEFAPDIGRASAALAELDCLLSLAIAARELNLCRPQLSRANELRIVGGRHLLTEQLVETLIPNDTTMGGSSGRVQIVTGPNFSGKSCYAKQVALITFLAHVGSFVPATSARVGLTDRIFTRLSSREAAAVPQSTFMIDLSQVAAMLALSTERSLCIIDEFGKGTGPADGLALLAATLRRFGALPCPPRVVLCTHFSEVFNPAILPRSPHLSFLTMGVVVDGCEQDGAGGSNDGSAGSSGGKAPGAAAGTAGTAGTTAAPSDPAASNLVFLYRLAEGRAAPSFGVHCAQLAGVPPQVLQRARAVIAAQAAGQAVAAAEGGQHAQRAAAYRSLVQRLLTLDVRDGEAVQQLMGAVLETTGGGERGGQGSGSQGPGAIAACTAG